MGLQKNLPQSLHEDKEPDSQPKALHQHTVPCLLRRHCLIWNRDSGQFWGLRRGVMVCQNWPRLDRACGLIRSWSLKEKMKTSPHSQVSHQQAKNFPRCRSAGLDLRVRQRGFYHTMSRRLLPVVLLCPDRPPRCASPADLSRKLPSELKEMCRPSALLTMHLSSHDRHLPD